MRRVYKIPADSYLEAAFVKWVLTPAALPGIAALIVPQQRVTVEGRSYRVDYELVGAEQRIAVELDGYAFHSARDSFTYDRLRQNDLAATGRMILRFSYDAVRLDTARCVAQLQAAMRIDPLLRAQVDPLPHIVTPEMGASPLHALQPGTEGPARMTYFDSIRDNLNLRTLRQCQVEAFAALARISHQPQEFRPHLPC